LLDFAVVLRSADWADGSLTRQNALAGIANHWMPANSSNADA